nr:hypothetical protein [Streptococcus intermedius]
MKIMLGTPITGIVEPYGNSKGISFSSRESIIQIINDIREEGHEVFCALELEDFGNVEVNNIECTVRDFTIMKDCDLYVVFPNNSYGCAVELGWASALSIPIFMLVNTKFNFKTPLYEGLIGIHENTKYFEYDSFYDFPTTDNWPTAFEELKRFMQTIVL